MEIIDMGEIELLMRAGKWAEAAEACRKLLNERPTDAKLHAYEGICYFRLNDFAKAEPCFFRASMLDPQFVDAAVKRCQCLDRLQRYDEALAEARQWVKLRPNDPALNAIIEVHQYRKDPLRTDGWEQSAHLNRNVRFASEA